MKRIEIFETHLHQFRRTPLQGFGVKFDHRLGD